MKELYSILLYQKFNPLSIPSIDPFFSVIFLGLHLWHIEVPRLGVESELQLSAYTTAMAMQDLSHVCDLHHQLMATPDP